MKKELYFRPVAEIINENGRSYGIVFIPWRDGDDEKKFISAQKEYSEDEGYELCDPTNTWWTKEEVDDREYHGDVWHQTEIYTGE